VEKVAGRELDALVAEKIMGFCVGDGQEVSFAKDGWICKCHNKFTVYPSNVKDYSISISAAWEVVEKVRTNWDREYGDDAPKQMKPYWQIVDCNEHGWRVDIIIGSDDGDALMVQEADDTAPLAICLAALKAVGEE